MKVARKATRTRTRPQRPAPRPAQPASTRAPRKRSTSELVQDAIRDGGAPLSEPVRSEMEARFRHDFGDVRVHSGSAPSRAAGALEADAFTTGQRIVFGAGRYHPETVDGRRLLAHELAHTVQQGPFGGLPQALLTDPAVRPVSDPLEREADTAADHAAAGRAVPVGLLTVSAPGAAGTIARQPTAVAPPTPAEVPEDPAALERVAQEIEQLMARDPDDVFDRVRRRLARLAPVTRAQLVSTLGGRVSDPARATLQQLVTELAPGTEPATETGRESGETAPPEPERGGEPERQATTPGPAERASVAEAAATGRAAAHEPADGAIAERMASARAAEPAPARAPADTTPPEPAEGPIAVPDLSGAEPTTQAQAPAAAEAPAPAGPAPPAPAAVPAPAAGPGEAEAEVPVNQEPVQETEADAGDELGAAEEESQPTPAANEPGPAAAAAAVAQREQAAAAATAGVEEPAQPAASAVEEAGGEAAADAGAIGEVGQEVSEPTVPSAEAGGGEPESENAEEPAEAAAPAELPAAASETEPPEPDAGASEVAQEAGETAGETAGGETEPLAEAAPEDDEGAEPGGAGADGGGGDGAAVADQPEPETPDLAGRDPSEAMATAGSLPPAQAVRALGGVSAAATRAVGEQRAELAASPPSVERPTGAPSAAERAAEEAAVAAPPAAPAHVDRAPHGAAQPTPAPEPLPAPPPPPGAAAQPPTVAGGAQGELSQADAAALADSVRRLPTSDPALAVTAGPAPRVALEGNADPARVGEQRTSLESAATHAQAEGTHDAAQPMGETQLYPNVEPETLVGTIGGTSGAGAAAAAPAGAAAAPAGAPAPAAAAAPGGSEEVDPAESAIAQEQRGDELRASAAQARTDMTARRQEQTETAAAERARSNEEIGGIVRDNAEQQTDQRRRARDEVRDQRGQWSTEQRELVTTARTEADEHVTTAATEVRHERDSADAEAESQVAAGNQRAATARREGEAQARGERERGQRESSGVLGWLARRAGEFFDGIKRAIQRAFEVARAAVRAAIEAAQRLAAAAIERARQAIVAAIRRAGDLLIAIGDRVLAGFPALRDRFRAAIRRRVQQAEDAVNRLANALKEGVQRALNLLGAALDAALGLLERGLLAVVAAYRAAVMGAIAFARSAIRALAEWGALIRDIAANPMQWLRNLGRAVVDGIRNHLWRAFKQAIKRWFNDKLDEVLGLGRAIWGLLTRGGLAIAAIGRMVWNALKQAIPVALIQILVEKLVAMIIPAAGAIMTIIEGLRAAWGTVGRILQALQRFLAFLRAVKRGGAGPLFARALAAAAIAVIDFVANWLVTRLRRPAGAIAGRIRAIAQRIGQRLARFARRFTRGLRRRLRRLRARFRRRRGRRHASGRRADRDRRRRERQERARRETRTVLERLLGSRVGGLRLRAQVWWLKQRWRWRTLAIRATGRGTRSVVGGFSPSETLVEADEFWEVRLVNYTLPRPAAQMSGGAEYEATVRPYIRGPLATQIAGGRPVLAATTPASPTLGIAAGPAHAQPSPIGTLRIQQSRGLRQGGLFRVPEAIATIAERDPATRRRVETEHHTFEATLDVNFSLGRKGSATHKQLQIAGTIFNLIQRFKSQPNVRFVYHIIAPTRPPESVKAYLQGQLREQGVTNARFVWRVIG